MTKLSRMTDLAAIAFAIAAIALFLPPFPVQHAAAASRHFTTSETITSDQVIGSGETWTIDPGVILTIDSGVNIFIDPGGTIDNSGTIINLGDITNKGTIDNSGSFVNNPDGHISNDAGGVIISSGTITNNNGNFGIFNSDGIINSG